ncbi:HDOD domain-containing protein [Actomonas aquatica]|uniref:HDOD domain-containing protein n=1 Tax=Actomonas aquatica TaxID=2866162 RepID=A0ABZ1CCL2_9BACT|nr:HDOD domain-containing protein [Opitutus sp. WL0086]WRQ89299.1 HDOD domain-containing protein [Opitutus sp. WL0086]
MVSTEFTTIPPATGPYPEEEIRKRLEACPKLASLQSVNRALAGLVNSEQSYNAQIAEIIRRDPSLTTRLLRMVNSVFFGLTAKVSNIEEAVFYLGVRQIRELSMATPVLEELERISPSGVHLPWRELWKHSIGCAIMSREILGSTSMMLDDDTDYIVGLLHHIGKVGMALAFPAETALVTKATYGTTDEVVAREQELIGWDHAQVGAAYLERHRLAPEIVAAVRWHHDPEKAGEYAPFAASVQLADLMVRSVEIGNGFEQLEPVEPGSWRDSAAWNILFQNDTREAEMAETSTKNALRRLPGMLNGLV